MGVGCIAWRRHPAFKHAFNYVFNFMVKSILIKVKYDTMSPYGMGFILNNLNHLYVGPMMEFQTYVTQFQ